MEGAWGLARAATRIRQIRKETPNVLLLDGGDTIQGAPTGWLEARRPSGGPHFVAAAMGALGYDAMMLYADAIRRAATLAAILREEPPPPRERNEEVPPELERIVLRCLRKDPARRFQTMADLNAAFREVHADATVKAIIITGAGSRFFVAGADIKELAAAGAQGQGLSLIHISEPTRPY